MLKGLELIVRGMSMVGTAMIGTNVMRAVTPTTLGKVGKACTSVAGVVMTSMLTDKVDGYISDQFKVIEVGIKAGIATAKQEAERLEKNVEDNAWEVLTNDTVVECSEGNSADDVDNL